MSAISVRCLISFSHLIKQEYSPNIIPNLILEQSLKNTSNISKLKLQHWIAKLFKKEAENWIQEETFIGKREMRRYY